MAYVGDPSNIPPGVLAAEERAAELVVWREHDLNWQCVHRLRRLSTNHATEAWRLRYHRPLAPYALAYLFTQPETEPGARAATVRAATRVWWSGAETTHLLPLLAAITNVARNREPGTAWDLREHIATRSDDGMADDAQYVGLGVSILHTATGTFEQACQSARDEWDIPGTILFLSAASPELDKQRAYIADRRGKSDFGQVTIHSHQALTRLNRSSPYSFSEVALDTLYRQFGHGQTLHGMWRLDRELRDADEVRRALQEQERTEREQQREQELVRHEQDRARQQDSGLPQAWQQQPGDTDRRPPGGDARRGRRSW